MLEIVSSLKFSQLLNAATVEDLLTVEPDGTVSYRDGATTYLKSITLGAPAVLFSPSSLNFTPAATSFSLNLAVQTAGTVFAAPAAVNGTPSFRALVATDIPSLDASKITTGILPVARGGTGASTLTGVLIGSGTSAFTAITGTSNQILRRNAANTAYEFYTLPAYLTVETDPIFSASPAFGITGGNITNWNTAFGWGNHAGLYSLLAHNHTLQSLTDVESAISIPPANYDVLRWNNSISKWMPWALSTTFIAEGIKLFFTNARARTAISLTVTGSSGASTYDNSTGIFNIPTYTLAGLGGQSLLVSGTNIKTVGTQTILGSGDITLASLNYWTKTANDLSYSLGDVSIGTTTADTYSQGGAGGYFTFQGSTPRMNIVATGTNTAKLLGGNETIRRGGIAFLDGSRIGFYTNTTNTGSAISEKVSILANGNVGINNNNPLNRLHILDAGAYHIRLERTGSPTNPAVLMGISAQTPNSTGDLLFDMTQASQGYAFRTRNGAGTVLNSFGINRDGDVGIGTFIPLLTVDARIPSQYARPSIGGLSPDLTRWGYSLNPIDASTSYDLVRSSNMGFRIAKETSLGGGTFTTELSINTSGYVGIGINTITGSAGAYYLQVGGDIYSSSLVGTTTLLKTVSGVITRATVGDITTLLGTGNYIINQLSGPQAANMWIDGAMEFTFNENAVNEKNLLFTKTNIGVTSSGYKFSWRNDNNSYRIDAITLDKNGDIYFSNKVGFGTTVPEHSLHVNSSNDDGIYINQYSAIITTVGGNKYQAIYFGNDLVFGRNPGAGFGGGISNYYFRTGTSNVNRLVISNAGYVGINIDTVSSSAGAYHLQVGGDIYSTSLTGATTLLKTVAGVITRAIDGTDYYSPTTIASANYWTLLSGNVYRATGFVGIGTSTPASQLHLYSDAPIFSITATNVASGLRLNILGQTTVSNAFRIQSAGTTVQAVSTEGHVGIGSTYVTSTSLHISKNIEGGGGTTGYGIVQNGVIQNDVTSARIYQSNVNVVSGHTVSDLFHFIAIPGTFSGTVTTQSGFYVSSAFVSATNNFGFRGVIPSATGRWNLYMDGTASNYLAGSLGVGSTSLAGINVRVSKTLNGNSGVGYGILNDGIVQSDVTTQGYGITNNLSTQAASFTIPDYYHFFASQVTIGSGSIITNQYGFTVSSTLVGATNNYGFYGNIPSGTGRWNLYMIGTALNYMAGDTLIGSASPVGTNKLQVTGNIYNSALVGATEALVKTTTAGVITRAAASDIASLIGTTYFIQNQNGSAQTANFWISGRGIVGATDQATYKFVIDSGSTTGNGLHVRGKIFSTDDIQSYSDKRLKENLQNVVIGDKFKGFNIQQYNRIGSNDIQIGVIAQDLAKIFPQLVSKEGRYYGVSYNGIATLALGLGIENKSEIDVLKDKVKVLEEEIKLLKAA